MTPDPLLPPQGFAADSDPPYGDDGGPPVDDPRWMRLLDWVEEHTTGPGSWPWGGIWLGRGLLRGFGFHFATGHPSGFALTIPLPRWLPGFVRSYQVDGPRRFWRGEVCPWWRDSDLHGLIPLFPPGLPFTSRASRALGCPGEASYVVVTHDLRLLRQADTDPPSRPRGHVPVLQSASLRARR